MNELVVVADKAAEWLRLKAPVPDSISSPITRRAYNLGLDEFIAWFIQEPRPGFTKATVSAWRVALEARKLGPISINEGECIAAAAAIPLRPPRSNAHAACSAGLRSNHIPGSNGPPRRWMCFRSSSRSRWSRRRARATSTSPKAAAPARMTNAYSTAPNCGMASCLRNGCPHEIGYPKYHSFH